MAFSATIEQRRNVVRSIMTQIAKTSPIVLLAEDSDDDAYFFQRAFKKSCVECTVLRVANGKQAIEILDQTGTDASTPPFLVFLDLKMPVMSGFDVLEWLKSSTMDRKPQVIVLSGSNDQADQARALALGAVEYLVKPITADVLRKRISEELGLGRQKEAVIGASI